MVINFLNLCYKVYNFMFINQKLVSSTPQLNFYPPEGGGSIISP